MSKYNGITSFVLMLLGSLTIDTFPDYWVTGLFLYSFGFLLFCEAAAHLMAYGRQDK